MTLLPTAAEWTAVWAFFTLLVIAVSATYAKGQLEEARDLRRAQTRPFVVADLELSGPWWLVDFVLNNVGSTVARNVRVEFAERPQSTLREWKFLDSRLITHGVTTMPPGKVITVLFDNVSQRAAATDTDLPVTYEVTVAYEDDFGGTYRDEYSLDLGVYMTRTALIRSGVHEAAETLAKIEKSIAGWTEQSNGVRVEVTRSRRPRCSQQMSRLIQWRERADSGSRLAATFFYVRQIRYTIAAAWTRSANLLYDLFRG